MNAAVRLVLAYHLQDGSAVVCPHCYAERQDRYAALTPLEQSALSPRVWVSMSQDYLDEEFFDEGLDCDDCGACIQKPSSQEAQDDDYGCALRWDYD